MVSVVVCMKVGGNKDNRICLLDEHCKRRYSVGYDATRNESSCKDELQCDGVVIRVAVLYASLCIGVKR